MEEEHHGMEEGLMKMQRNLLELAGTAGGIPHYEWLN